MMIILLFHVVSRYSNKTNAVPIFDVWTNLFSSFRIPGPELEP